MKRLFLAIPMLAAVLAAGCDTSHPSFANMTTFTSDKPLRTLPVLTTSEKPPTINIQPPTNSTGKIHVEPGESVARRVVLGTSVEGRSITMYLFGTGPNPTLIFGGIHGDEGAAADIARQMIDHLRANPAAWSGRSIAIIPEANPDGLARGTRQNANGVDCNRNFPASNWAGGSHSDRYYGGASAGSEPETKALMQAIQQLNPGRIVSLHSISPGKHCNNYDGPGQGLAKRMAAANHYPVKSNIGYPTPGSFGTWAGIDRHIATITLELPAGRDAGSLWSPNKAALLAAIRDQQPALGN
ncbi:MAG: M14 family murein peptide amidase A [Planctomycetota bacterium]|nr:M14 family murein peptide amidase A [Planctomycetota bacterium]